MRIIFSFLVEAKVPATKYDMRKLKKFWDYKPSPEFIFPLLYKGHIYLSLILGFNFSTMYTTELFLNQLVCMLRDVYFFQELLIAPFLLQDSPYHPKYRIGIFLFLPHLQ